MHLHGSLERKHFEKQDAQAIDIALPRSIEFWILDHFRTVPQPDRIVDLKIIPLVDEVGDSAASGTTNLCCEPFINYC